MISCTVGQASADGERGCFKGRTSFEEEGALESTMRGEAFVGLGREPKARAIRKWLVKDNNQCSREEMLAHNFQLIC